MSADLTLSRRSLFAGAFALAAAPLAEAIPLTQGGQKKGLSPAADFLLEPGVTYLQTGSAGAIPRQVMDTTFETWKDIELSPTLKCYRIYEEKMDAVRAKAATFLGATTNEIVLTQCTTDGMNGVAQGLGLAPGDRILTTDQEHPGGRVCWDYMVRTRGISIDEVKIAPGENDLDAIVSQFRKALTPRTKAVVFSHVLSSTGLRMPVAEITALARERGVLSIVDGAQAPGGIAVDVKKLGCDVYATSGHKWLLGPKGTGLLFIKEGLEKVVDPIDLQAGRAAYSDSSGLGNIPGVMGLGRAIDYLTEIGINRIEAHNLALRDKLFGMLAAIPEAKIVSPKAGPGRSPMLTYQLSEKLESRALMEKLRLNHNVIVKMVPKNWFNGQRISTHLFNDERDLEKLVHALKAEIKDASR